MAIGRISGQLLKSNLLRNGVDLAFENDLLYLDVSDPNPAKHKIGIKKSNPAYALDVNGTVQATAIITPSFDVETLRVDEVDSDLIPSTDDAFDLGNAISEWRSLTVGQISVDSLFINDNTITTLDSNANIEIRPQGTGIVVIDTNTSLKIPFGSEITRPLGSTAEIRFNTTNNQFEGYNGLGWVSLGATRDIDGNTRITAELTTGANDNTFRFYNDGVLTGTWDIERLDIHKITVDDNMILDQNVINTTRDNTNLELRAHGTGKIYVPVNNVDIDNDLNVDGFTTLDDTTIDGVLQINGQLVVNTALRGVIGSNGFSIDGGGDANSLLGGSITMSGGTGASAGDIVIQGGVSQNLVSGVGGNVYVNGGQGATDGQVFIGQTNTVGINLLAPLTVTQDTEIQANVGITGDLRIDGQDLTASTTTFNLVNTTAASVNFAGEATAIEIGAATGTTSINHNLTVDGNVTLGNASTDSVLLNASTVNVPNQVTLTINDANNTFISYPLNVQHTTSGTPSNGMGTGIRFVAETSNNLNKVGMSIDAITTDVTFATEDFDMVVRLMDDGNLAAERFRVSSVGTGTFVGNLNVNAGTISTTSTVGNLFNTTTSEVNIAGAATRVEIGAASGVTNINNNLDVDGDVNIDGDTVSTTSSTLNLANTTTTTVNAFGDATSITLGADTGTTTIRNDLVVDGGVTVNNDSEIRFKESVANGQEYVGIKAPESLQESYLLKLPVANGRFGQLLTNDGTGQLQWSPADTLVGNRLYVSAAYGDDKNNGFDAPVKTVKRAAELIDEYIYTPKRTVSQAEHDTKTILKANKDYLRAEVIGYLDSNYAFIYDKATCARDTGLIVQSLAFDLLFNGNTQSTFSGLRYWAQAATAVPGQVEETVAAITHAREISVKAVQNIVIQKQVGNTSLQNTSLPAATLTTANLIKDKFNKVISIINNGTTGVSNDIINNDYTDDVLVDPDYIKAINILQANKSFIQDDTIAYINNNFAFTYQPIGTAAGQAICSRDTGLIVQSLAYDLLYQGNTQAAFAGLRYWDRGVKFIPTNQVDETVAAIEYAKTLASQAVLNTPITKTLGNSASQVFDLDNPGSGAGAAIIQTNFERITAIVNDSVADISGTIVNNGLKTTSNSIINTAQLLQDNKEFIKAETIAWVENRFRYTYDSAKCERDTGLIIDAVSYDIALGTNYNAVTAGLAYQRGNAAYVESNQLYQTVETINNWIKVEAADSLVSSATAVSRSNAAIAEIVDILQNGEANADSLTFTLPPIGGRVTQDVIDAFNQLRANRAFLQAEVVAYVNANTPPAGYDQAKCYRDVGYIVDALSHDMLYGGNTATITNALAYYVGAVLQLGAGQTTATLNAYTHLSSVIGNVVQAIAVVKTPGNVQTQDTTTYGPASSTEANTLAGLITVIKNYIADGVTLPSTDAPDLSWVDAGIITARNTLIADKSSIVSGTTTYIANRFQSLLNDPKYSAEKCARDVERIIDCVTFDLLHGGNRQSTQAGVYYYTFDFASDSDSDGLVSLIPQEIPQTLAAYTYLKTLVTNVVLNQEPTTRYQTGVAREAALPTSASAVLALQNDIDLIINIIQNGPSVAPTRSAINLTASNDAEVAKAFAALRANEAFIRAEIIGFISATFSQIADYDSTKCRRDVGYILDSVSFDLKYGGNRQVTQAGVYYYTNNATITNIPGQRSQTVAAFNRLKTVVQAIITGSPYTPLQTDVSRVTLANTGTIDQYLTVAADIDRIINIVNNGPAVAETLQSISLTKSSELPDLYAHELLVANEEFIKAEITQYIDNTFTGLIYNKEICSRDVGYIVDAVIYDLHYGGNAKAIYSGNRYYQGTTSTNKVINEQKVETIAAINYLATIAKNVLEDENPTIQYSNLTREKVADLGVVTSTATRAASTAAIKASIELVADVLENPFAAPTIDYGDGYNAATGSIFVASGDYVEDNPIIIPDNVSVIGGDLRSVIIRPKNSKRDMFRLRNGSYMSGFTWRDNIDPITKVPQFTWNFATTFDDPTDTLVSRGAYPLLPLVKPTITQSPYIQNVSIISFLGGSGALIDGNLVVTPNVPRVLEEVEVALNVTDQNTIPEQGKSMVANAYTMVSFGGVGWKLINDAYAQIVSCFQIFLLEGVVCRSGGYCSITNSATNFGLYALRASGYSPNAFTFDRGWLCASGVARGKQTLTAIGFGRAPVNEFVVRIRSKDDQTDITSQYLTEQEEFLFNPAVVDPVTDIFTIPGHGLQNKERVTYYNNGGVSIGGLENGQNYYVYNIDIDTFKLYFDETLTIPMDITSVGSGGKLYDTVEPIGGVGQPDANDSSLHKFVFVVEEFFVDERIETHSVFQKLTLAPGNYTFRPGAQITGTTIPDPAFPMVSRPNNAYVYSYNNTTKELIVSINLITVDNVNIRQQFNDSSIITQDQSSIPVVDIDVIAADIVTGLVSSTFTIESTVQNSLLQNLLSVPEFRVWLHRPSIVNSSSHTWEYAGSGIDYNALPQNGGQTREEYEQYNEPPGRVYTSGTNELGDFKVGDFITAENKTGNITFRNEVTVGQLNALRLSLSDIEINKISNDVGLGDNEAGGPSDSALVTQLAIRTFIQNRLGPVIDKQVSTNANAGALVQLNSSGQINRDLIPPLRTTNAVTTYGFNSRLELSEDQPAVDVLASDTVVEAYRSRMFTLSGTIVIARGAIIKQANSGAYGEVVTDTNGSIVEIADIKGTFTTNVADILTDAADVPLGSGTVYPTTIGGEAETQTPYILTIDTISQFLVLANKTNSPTGDYNFTIGNLVSSTINNAIGQITAYKYGIVTDLNVLSYTKGTGYTPTTGTVTYLDVPLTGGSGTGARADITVTNGQVQNIDLLRGGTGYIVGDVLSAAASNLGGTVTIPFSIPVTGIEQRLYVNLSSNIKFIPTSTVIDFIADNNAPVKTIANLTGTVVKTFNAPDISGGGDVDYTTSRITVIGHGYANGDPVVYSSETFPEISPLNNNDRYFVKVISADVFELYLDYALTTKVVFSTSSTGTHKFTILRSNFIHDVFYIPSHGFTIGDAVEITGADLPIGLTSPRYYVGSVTTNSFSLHVLRLDALASTNGLTINGAEFGDQGTGSMTFTKQNVQVVGNINTSSNLADSYSVLSTTNVDAGNIISGIINTSRLGVGTANTSTFLRGDNSWQTVITSVRKLEGSPVSITGPFTTDSTTNFYYGDVALDVDRVSGLQGDANWSNFGVASFYKAQFDILNGQVAVKSGSIDALSLGGLPASYFLDPSNLALPVPVNRGGTGLNSLPPGSMLYGSTVSAAAALALGTANSVLVSNGSSPEWSINLSLPGNLSVNGDVTIGNASTDSFTINPGSANVPNSLHFNLENTDVGSVSYPIQLRHSVTGVPIVGVGTGIEFATETAGNNFEIGTIIESMATSVTGGAENFDVLIKTMINGATAAQVLKINNNTLQIGASGTNTTLTTQGQSTLILNTNNGSNSGSITVTHGANGNILISPNGTGKVLIAKTTEVTGDVTVSSTLTVNGALITNSTVNSITTLTTVDSFNRTIYRSAKYQVQITCTAGPDAGKYQASEILVIHDGTTSYFTEYAVLKTGPNELGIFTADISADDVRLRITPTTSDTLNIKVVRTAQLL